MEPFGRFSKPENKFGTKSAKFWNNLISEKFCDGF